MELVGVLACLARTHADGSLATLLSCACSTLSTHNQELRDRPVFGDVRPVLDEVFLGQLARSSAPAPSETKRDSRASLWQGWRGSEAVMKQGGQIKELMALKFDKVND